MKARHTSSRTLAALVAGLLITDLASAATNTWSGASAPDLFWSTAGNWLGGIPAATNATMFDDTDATGISGPYGTANNIVNASVAIQTLKYGNTNGFHTTQILLGSTLTVTGSVSPNVYVGTGADNGNAQIVYATVLGQGGLHVTNNSGAILIIQGSQTSGATKRATLDMEGLDNFTAYVRQIRVGAENGGSSTPWFNRGAGTLILARTNLAFLSSPAGTPGLFVSEGSGSSAVNIVRLGQTNAIFNDAGITVGGRKSDNGTVMSFNPAFTSPSAFFRNLAGTGRQALWAVGDNVRQSSTLPSTSSGASTGVIDFSNGTVDAQVSTIVIGRGPSGSGDTGKGTGTLTFDGGTLNTDALDIGVSSTANVAAGVGTINVNGSGLLVVNTLHRLAVGAAASGTLNINGGTVRANSIVNGGGTTTADIYMNGGTLVLTNTAGSIVAPILNFTMADSTLTLPVTSTASNIVVTTLSTGGTTTNNTINVLSLPTITGYSTQFPLISYTYFTPSGGPDFLLGSLPVSSPPYEGYISNNTTTSTIDLVITKGPTPTQVLFWNGNVSGGNWDTTTANWRNASLAAAIFRPGDFVNFDDSASGTTTAALTGTLLPGSLTVSNVTKPYTFSGSGNIGGAIALTKAGTGMLTIANTGINTFSNGVSILDGTVKLSGGTDRLPTDSIVTLADVAGAKLDLNNLNQTLRSLNGGGFNGGDVTLGSATLTDWSGGTYGGVISGSGQLIKTNWPGGPTGVLTLTNANTYTGGTIIGGYTNATTLAVGNQTGSGTGSGSVQVLTNGVLSLGAGATGGSVAAGTITNSGIVRLNRGDDFVFTNTVVGAGGLQKQNTNVVSISGANPYLGITALDLGTLRVANAGALGIGTVVVGNGAATLQLTNGITLTNSLYIGSKPSGTGPVPCVENISGNNTLTGSLSLTQNGGVGWLFSATDGHLLVSGTMSRLDSSQTSQNTTRIFWLRGDATGEWSGSIIDPVGGTTNLALRKDGLGTWTLSGANTYTGPTVVSNGTLLVSGSIAGSSSVTVQGGTLAGTGTIAGPVTVNALGTLAPGASIGALTINNDLTLAGTTVMEVSHAATDRVTGLGTVTLGGTLQVVVQGTLSGNEVFKLFSATSYTGNFTYYDLPLLPNPLGWDYSTVAVDGTLKITGGAPILGVSQAGNVLTFTWTEPGFRLQAQTNSLTVGLSSNWGDYPSGTSSPVNVTISPANPTVFFRLVSP
jgi:autotransporter-associated beta strand protein